MSTYPEKRFGRNTIKNLQHRNNGSAMQSSISGFLIAGLLMIFGVWQHAGQKKLFARLTAETDQKKTSPLRAFLIRQTRRRMQTGILFALAGAAMFAGLQIPPQDYPNICICVWLLSILFLLWAIFLTTIDIFAIRFRYNEEKSIQDAAKKGLEYLRRQQQAGKKDGPGGHLSGDLSPEEPKPRD